MIQLCSLHHKQEEKIRKFDYTVKMSDSIRIDAVTPDSPLAWVAVIAAFACNVISDGIVFSFGIIQSEMVDFFEEPVVKVAWVFAIMNSISLILGAK